MFSLVLKDKILLNKEMQDEDGAEEKTGDPQLLHKYKNSSRYETTPKQP